MPIMVKHKMIPTYNPTNFINLRTNQSCNSPVCVFCIMKEPQKSKRKNKILTLFKEMPRIDNENNIVEMVSGLWNMAMARPDDPELPSLGIFECMAKLIQKGVNDRAWLLQGENIYVPYYASHIIGSYTMNKSDLAETAVKSGVIPPLMELLRGRMSWVEQRVGARALGHLASYDATFDAVAEYQEEVVLIAMEVSSTCLDEVYNKFVAVENRTKREKYHMDLLCRGVGGVGVEERKAEEWASQLQCWCIHLLNCFAYKERCLDLICKPGFLRKLCRMWGGLVNDASPAGYGLIRILCYNNYSRKCLAKLDDVIISLGNLSRSSDDWQYIGIHCLLLLLKDQDTRYKVFDTSVAYLVDLVELAYLNERSSNIGQEIMSVLLSDYTTKGCVRLEEVHGLIERQRKEKAMPYEEMEERKVLVNLAKQQGNKCFYSGNIQEAINKYSEGLKYCSLINSKRERIVLLSNRAQCYLVLKDANAAISDTTKALCLTDPPNSHSKSLWRRSQAYDIKGLAKESLMDCIMFLTCCTNKKLHSSTSNYVKIPYHAARMIRKQMNATWLFNKSRFLSWDAHECSNNDDILYKKMMDDQSMKKLCKEDSNDLGTFVTHEGGSEGRKERKKRRNRALISRTM